MDVRQAADTLLHRLTKVPDRDVPKLLLTIEEMLREHDGREMKEALWETEILNMLTEILQSDFPVTYKLEWSIAARLCTVLAKCCVGFTHPPDFATVLLPLVIDTIMGVGASIQTSENPDSNDFKVCMECVYWLIEYSPVLAPSLIESPRLLQMMMSESEAAIEQCILRLLRIALLALDIDYDVDDERLLNLFDEMMYKLYTSPMPVRQVCADVLYQSAKKHANFKVLLMEHDDDIVQDLAEGATLGVHDNINILIHFLKDCRREDEQKARLNLSATKIQSHFRGYATRKKLRLTSQKVSKFQLRFKEFIKVKKERKELEKKERLENDLVCRKKRDRRKNLLSQQAAQLRTIPASELHSHQHMMETVAASKIQAAWRMGVARRKVDAMRKRREENRAAVLIQREYRKYRGDGASCGYLPPGLTAEKVKILNQKIKNMIQNQPELSAEESEKALIKSQEMYLNYTKNLGNIRRIQKRRQDLCSSVSDRITQLVNAPSLTNCTADDIGMFSCNDPVILEQARRNHRDCVSSRSGHRTVECGVDTMQALAKLEFSYSPLTYKIQQIE